MIGGVGTPRYTATSWARLREVADDRDDLVDTVEEYELKAERLIRQFEAPGYRVERVMVDVGAMLAWCRREGFRVDQKGRAAYGACLLASVGHPEGSG
jgi:hypothetical protein